MTLVSAAFRNLLIGLVAVIALATFLLWDRIPGPRTIRLAVRGILLLTGQFFGIVALLVTLNISYGGLVVTWADLMGEQTTQGARMAGQPGKVTMNPVAKVTSRPIIESQGFGEPDEDGFLKTTLRGPSSGVTSQVYVLPPPGYDQHPDHYYPVLELLHGVPDSPGAWMRQMRVASHLESGVDAGAFHPFILVIPNATPYPDHSSPRSTEECTDLSSDDRIETWITRDVRNLIIGSFRAIEDPSGWGLLGYSAGGFAAVNLVLKHPDLYKAAVSISGYYSPESPLVTADPEFARENDPVWRVSHTRTPPVSILMTASAQDAVDPPSESHRMLAAARTGARDTELQEYVAPLGGGHNQGAWEKMLPTAFRWFTRRLSGPVTPS
ncbi:alpha/beta hydrolase-fold protein [Spirillospora sp. NPDC052269]